MNDNNRLYGSTATSNGLNLSRAFRSLINRTAKRGPNPGIETKAHNAWVLKCHSNSNDSGIRKAG